MNQYDNSVEVNPANSANVRTCYSESTACSFWTLPSGLASDWRSCHRMLEAQRPLVESRDSRLGSGDVVQLIGHVCLEILAISAYPYAREPRGMPRILARASDRRSSSCHCRRTATGLSRNSEEIPWVS